MAYAQNTIIDANAANIFAGVLNGLMIDAGWTVVETLTPSTTFRTVVYKSAGTGNAAGYDWYIALMYNTVGTEQQVQIIAGNAYNSGTHILSGIGGSAASQNPTAGNAYNETSGAHMPGYGVNVATDTLTSWSAHGNSMIKPWFAVIVPSSAFGYWMSVTLDHVGVYTTIPGIFFASTLAMDPAYTALSFVMTNPIVSAASGAGIGNAGPSGAIHGQGLSEFASNNITDTTRPSAKVGAPLPILAGNYLPAYAWRGAWYLTAGAGGATTSAPAWDNPAFGDGLHIGDAIDYYQVNGGNLGDTVDILGSTYVLSGNLASIGTLFFAMLVE